MNDLAAAFVVFSCFAAPFPVALNRPSLWLLWLALTAVFVLLYVGLTLIADRGRATQSSQVRWLFALAAIVPAWAALQGSMIVGDVFSSLVSGLGGPDAMRGMDRVAISVLPEASSLAALRFIGYILLAFLVIEVSARPERARWVALGVFGGVCIHALMALFALNVWGDATILGLAKDAYQGFATGGFINRNSFATFLGMGAVLGVVLAFDRDGARAIRNSHRSYWSNDRLDQALVWVGVVAVVGTLMATGSRMGVGASAVGLTTAVVLMKSKSGLRAGRILLGLFLLAAVASVMAVTIYGQDVIWRFFFVSDDFATRWRAYALNWQLILERPLLGYGFDAFRPSFELVQTSDMQTNRVWDRAHSTYLSNWTELGFVVGSVPIVIALAAGVMLYRKFVHRSVDYALPAAGICVLVVGGVHSTVDFSLEMPANVILFITVVCLGLAPRRQRQRQHQSNNQPGIEPRL